MDLGPVIRTFETVPAAFPAARDPRRLGSSGRGAETAVAGCMSRRHTNAMRAAVGVPLFGATRR